MKNTLVLIACATLSIQAQAQGIPDRGAPTREHRAVWTSPFLNSTWPGGSITPANAAAKRTNLGKDLDRLHSQGVNTIYYHARANCDATYQSSYEPYASQVAGSRGGTPAFDPFEYLVEACHERGMEVYAWVNPYRYSSGGTYGAGELNYENSHPEWLIRQKSQIILNPGIPEVQNRIEAVVSEIATKYDIDGMIFDDYFYTSNTPTALDSAQYNVYRASGGKLLQDAWRRENVNETVRRSRDAVKAARPYAVFSIGPAGRISPPDIADYGLEPAPHGDMQYDSLHADPIKWLNEGLLDFLSPQVYWADMFESLTDWYSTAVPHFGRHLYTSVDLSRLRTNKAAEYLHEISYMRSRLRPNENGVVFFDYGAYVNYSERFEGGPLTSWGKILAAERFQTQTLQPLQPWRRSYQPAAVSNVRREGNQLRWDGPTDKAFQRYTVYAVPADEATPDFACDRNRLAAVRYTDSYTIPDDLADMHFAVAVYDRYGYEHAPLFENTEAGTAVTPVIIYPADGATACDLFDFQWKAEPGRYMVETSSDPSFSNVKYCAECTSQTIPSRFVADYADGDTIYWRVRVLRANGAEAVSAVQSLETSRIAITSPAADDNAVPVCPTVKWTAAGEGASYTLEISSIKSFRTIDYTAEVSSAEVTVPENVLKSGTEYFARVTAARNGSSSMSTPVSFRTEDIVYDAPVLVNPASDGQVLHSDDCIRVAPWPGMALVNIEVSATTSFPARSVYKGTLKDFETASRALGDIKVGGKVLADGQTYYVRARGTYNLSTSSSAVNTDYSPVRTFVYSSTAGITDVNATESAYIIGDILHTPAGTRLVNVYDTTGRLVQSAEPDANGLVPLDARENGCYIIHISGANIIALKWVK